MVKSGWTIIAIKKSTRERLKNEWGATPYEKPYDTALTECLDSAKGKAIPSNQLIPNGSQAQIISLVCDLSSLIPANPVMNNAEKKSNSIK